MTRLGWRVKLGAILALAVGTAAAVAVLISSGPSGATAVSPRAVAAREAGRLIAAVRIPSAVVAAPAAPGPAEGLAGLSRAAGPATVERSKAWTVPRSATGVRAFLSAHPPPGTRPLPGTPLIFVAVRDPRGVAAAHLALSVVATGPRSSVVHADALVRWLVTRSTADRVPVGAHLLEITRGPAGRAPSLVIHITAGARIARIRELLNHLSPVQPGRVYHCPAQFPEVPVVSFIFRAGGARSRVLASAAQQADVSSPTTACNAMHLSIGGREQTSLLGGHRLLRQVSALLGRRLWTRPYAA